MLPQFVIPPAWNSRLAQNLLRRQSALKRYDYFAGRTFAASSSWFTPLQRYFYPLALIDQIIDLEEVYLDLPLKRVGGSRNPVAEV